MSKAWRQRIHVLTSVFLVLLIGVFTMTPLYWIVNTSLKEPGTEFRIPLEYWPAKVSLQAYRDVLGPNFRIQDAIRNSVIVSSSVTVAALFFGSLAAYTIARLRFKYKIQSLMFMQVAGMMPAIITIAPTFVLIRSLGLLGKLPGLILPNIAYCIPVVSWLMAAYFAALPFELEDAGKMDGYTPFGVFWRVIMPLATPGLFSAGVIAFLGSWGEFMLALTIGMGVRTMQTVPVAILGFSRNFDLQWAWVSAGVVMSLAPIILLVVVFQRWVIRGLTAGAIKY